MSININRIDAANPPTNDLSTFQAASCRPSINQSCSRRLNNTSETESILDLSKDLNYMHNLNHK